jgi:hypothetical protein
MATARMKPAAKKTRTSPAIKQVNIPKIKGEPRLSVEVVSEKVGRTSMAPGTIVRLMSQIAAQSKRGRDDIRWNTPLVKK